MPRRRELLAQVPGTVRVAGALESDLGSPKACCFRVGPRIYDTESGRSSDHRTPDAGQELEVANHVTFKASQ